MDKDIYGYIKEKYPKALATRHNILMLKYNILKHEIDEKSLKMP